MSDRIEGKSDGFTEVSGMFRNFLQTMMGGEGSFKDSFNDSFRAMTQPGAAAKVLADAFDGKTPPTIG